MILKTVDVIFTGYALDSKVNQFLVVNSDISEISNNIIIEARNVYFENIFPFKSRIPSDPSCLLLSLIFIPLVLLLLLSLNLEEAKELELLHPSMKTSLLILQKVILTLSKKQ